MTPPRPPDIGLESLALEPLVGVGRRFRYLVTGLLAIVTLGTAAYALQLVEGLRVTDMAPTVNKMMWGLYIVNFVFFIGISHAGTLISAILRVAQAEWRRPITRMAEFITVVALVVGGLMPIIDLGRPDRMTNLFVYGRWSSPILWDFFSITTYLFGSLLYLYLPLVPDLALCRDRLAARVSAPKRWFFQAFAIQWRGTPIQRRALGRALTLMMVLIIPIAVSVHTVVSWIFGMTLRVGWNSTVYGIYFVAGAIFSGTATLIVVMAILRRVFRLHAYLPDRQFVNLGYLLAVLSAVMLYFNLSEYVTTGYKLEEGEGLYLASILVGPFAPWYWFYVLGGLVLPAGLMLVPRTRSLRGVLVAAVLADVAMWIERYLIVVATLRAPQMPYADLAVYVPTWVELAITAGAFALFALLIALFTKLVPVISIWEVREHEEVAEGRAEPAPTPAAGRTPWPAVGMGLVLAALVPILLPDPAFAHAGHERPGTARPKSGSPPPVAIPPSHGHGAASPDAAPHHGPGAAEPEAASPGGKAPGRGPDALRPVRLGVAGPGDARLGEAVAVTATLTTPAGEPVRGATIRFATPAAWGEFRGEVELGTVKTDAKGIARLSFPARRSGATEIEARFDGDGRLAARASLTVTVGGDRQLFTTRMPAVSSGVTRVAPVVLAALLATVWSLYFVVARLVLTIARAGNLAPARHGAPGMDASRRRLLQSLVPAGMHAAIAPVGVGLVTVIARSPYTHSNLEGYQPEHALATAMQHPEVAALLERLHRPPDHVLVAYRVPAAYMMQHLIADLGEHEAHHEEREESGAGPVLRHLGEMFALKPLRQLRAGAGSPEQRVIFTEALTATGARVPASRALDVDVLRFPLFFVELAGDEVRLVMETPRRHSWGTIPVPAF